MTGNVEGSGTGIVLGAQKVEEVCRLTSYLEFGQPVAGVAFGVSRSPSTSWKLVQGD